MVYQTKRKMAYGPIAKRVRVYAPAAAQLAKDVAYLGTLINSEPKYHIALGSDNIDREGRIVELSKIPNGTGGGSRDGNTILPRFLSVKGNMFLTATNTEPYITVRMIIFKYWGQQANDNTKPAPEEILTSNGTQYAPFGFLNDDITGGKGDRTRRIEILHNDIVTLNTTSNGAFDFDYNIKMNGQNVQDKQHTKFLDTVLGNPVSGAFYIMFISSQSTTTHIGYQVASKLVFYDN